MASYFATLSWSRGAELFSDGKYSRAHEIAFDAPLTIPASSSPHVVKLPYSCEDAVDPEEMLVASLSSCHFLSFVWVAQRAGFIVDSYHDAAEGMMAKNDAGKMWVSKVTLRPAIAWSGDKRPSAGEIEDMHHKAHDECFIANSYKGEVAIEAPR